MSGKTTLERLEDLERVVANMTDEEFRNLVNESNMSEESCEQYAFIENSLLNTEELNIHSPEFLRQT